MAVTLPDPVSVAKQQVERVHADRQQVIDGPVDRVLADAPWADRQALFSGFVAYQKERLDRIPPAAKYPEAQPWVEQVLAVDRELRRAGLSDWEIAVLGGINDYLAFRGYRLAAQSGRNLSGPGTPGPRLSEKCRVAYLPQADQGQAFIVNGDDPATFWRKDRNPPNIADGLGSGFWRPLEMAGVGSGLHLDLEPDEIFPLPVGDMRAMLCDDLSSTIEFLTRYCHFFGGGNMVVRDANRNSIGIEKCSRSFIEIFHPTVAGRSHVSGMVCRDPNSPQGRHQRAMREEYLGLSGRTWDDHKGSDVAFWDACDLAERILADFLNSPDQITVDALLTLFTTPFPRGLRKDGAKFHPDQGYVEYTLITYLALLDKRQVVRYQCEDPPGLEWPSEPEVHDV